MEAEELSLELPGRSQIYDVSETHLVPPHMPPVADLTSKRQSLGYEKRFHILPTPSLNWPLVLVSKPATQAR
jgi:hypothetical protein